MLVAFVRADRDFGILVCVGAGGFALQTFEFELLLFRGRPYTLQFSIQGRAVSSPLCNGSRLDGQSGANSARPVTAKRSVLESFVQSYLFACAVPSFAFGALVS